MSDSDSEPFTKVMRKATRNIHNVSDALVNAKLGFAMSDNGVWSGGLLVFYEVFKQLEAALDRHKDGVIGQLDIEGMRRKDAFEKDLIYYLGETWKRSYAPDRSVIEYIDHLIGLEKAKPVLLTAYIYHLYMGLFAGGQILRKKRALAMKLKFSSSEDMEGLAVVDLRGETGRIKREMADNMNAIAKSLDEETKQALIEESKNVFVFNNKIINSVKGTNQVLIKMLFKFAVVAACLAIMFYYFFVQE